MELNPSQFFVTDFFRHKIICDEYCDGEKRFVTEILTEISVTMWRKSLGEEVYFRFVTDSVTIFHHKHEIKHLPTTFLPYCDEIPSQIIFVTEFHHKICHNFV